ncbi:MerR family transcriptional regulator [Nocardia sp. AG03]|uniref:MerR family transcriptional regulator n=1 Tax=Nocardia sp. AG03 TaxID=3025312 RepID=UPI0024183DD9|nr:MerR family transcriptional regulator [Nocardia sp. AG03]
MSDPVGVSIGKAAALYDVAPSTLRWWESQRVLPEPARVNGRRVYDESDLRRIGLAYLCCVTSAMSLEQAAVVTVGRRNELWQRTVRSHAAALARKIEELQSARDYLTHLLECADDDIVDECPWLDGELMSRTPRGRVPVAGFVAAAQAVSPRRDHAERCDETAAPCVETSPTLGHCVICASVFAQPGTGRRRRYCSRACRQRHYRETAAARQSTDAAQ